MSKKSRREKLIWECEQEFARVNRLKRRLRRLKQKVKDHAKNHSEQIVLPTEKIKVKKEKVKIRKTYKVLDRVEKDGWPMFLLERNTDNKRKIVNTAKFRELQKRGKIIGFVPAPRVNDKFQKARPPRGAYAIQVGAEGHRVDIVYAIGTDWRDLMCYHHKYQTMMHLKREDLYPKENVDEAIAFLQKLDSEEREAKK